MIRAGFLNPKERLELTALARDGLTAARVARRANAMVLLDAGWSCQQVAAALLFDDDTVRGWYKLYETGGVSGLMRFEAGGSASLLSAVQEQAVRAYVAQTLPPTARQIGAYIEREFGIGFDSRAGVIGLLHRLGFAYHKPQPIGRRLNEADQKAFVASYDNLLNSLAPGEAVLFADAVHPTHAARPAGCWAPKQDKLAIAQTSGRERLNIHGALDLETGQTRMIEADTIDAASTIRLMQSIETLYPAMRVLHVFLDNARYHHAKQVQEWLTKPGCRIRLHFIPAYCPHLNPIERLWGVMHKHVTHNKCYATGRDFAAATLGFLRQTVPKHWAEFRDSVTDNFRIISPKDFRVVT
jgi:transposase